MAETVTVIGIVGLLLVLEACIIVFVWRTGRSLFVRVGAILLSALTLLYALPELYSVEGRTTQALGNLSQVLGFVLLCVLTVALMACVVLYVRTKWTRCTSAKGCRKCGLENPAGTWVCKGCRSIWPEYPIALLVVALSLFFTGFTVIAQIFSLPIFDS